MFQALRTLSVNGKKYEYFSLAALEEQGLLTLNDLPYSIRVLLESVLRNEDGVTISESDVRNLASWNPTQCADIEVPFKPARVILQDFTGVPAVVDLAAMRAAMQRLGKNPKKINPLIPVDLIIDHSVQTDCYATPDALEQNVRIEFERNAERYALLHWAQQSLDNFRVIPPSIGIIHQVNLEYLASVVMIDDKTDIPRLYPDSVVGTDSHTVMINGLGVLGWGVGGIEAEAVMLGLPYYMLAPEVIGMELLGQLRTGVTATDLVLTLTELLRKEKVVGKFVEYLGQGAESMSVAERAVLANMAPEYGATMGFFPVDQQTIRFLHETGRDSQQIAVVEQYTKVQGLFREAKGPTPKYTKVLQLDLATVEPSLAGPKRPQDRIPLSKMKVSDREMQTMKTENSVENPDSAETGDSVKTRDNRSQVTNHSVVIASITSCTNTSNPRLMIAAGLLAKKAVDLGLAVPSYVKTSLAPGSRVVTEYLQKAGLLVPLEKLGFHVVGYGCLTCIGNSGPLPEPVAKEILDADLLVSAVLSGNRNFEGRVHPLVKANFLASPPLVLAFALAGTTNIDLTTEPLGETADGRPIFLHDIWPTEEELDLAEKSALDPHMYQTQYNNVGCKNERWNAIASEVSELFDWDRNSTYIQEPPFLLNIQLEPGPVKPIEQARVLAFLGDSTTTDHISPAGSIKADSPAGRFLLDRGVMQNDFNSYGARRGNDRVMTRGTFANIRIRNQLVPGMEGGMTKHFPSGQVLPIYDAAIWYQQDRTPLVIVAGAEYGTGSSRDWAAKGTALLGVRAVLAISFERIHRGNLVGMGVLPLEFVDGATPASLNLDGTELFSFDPIGPDFIPGSRISVRAEKEVSPGLFAETTFQVKVRIDTPVELEYYLGGGILPTVLRKLA
ncbi:MAG: aconitate hydratase AcnA [Thermoguttaceae bacterium]